VFGVKFCFFGFGGSYLRIFSVIIKEKMNLIIVAQLTCNEGLYFRHISMSAKIDLGYSVLVEAPGEKVDEYYKVLKRKGWFDFVDDIIIPEWREEGVRIDTELNYPRTIKTNQINYSNTLNILGQIKSLRGLTY
jgi:hypothetical protein